MTTKYQELKVVVTRSMNGEWKRWSRPVRSIKAGMEAGSNMVRLVGGNADFEVQGLNEHGEWEVVKQ